MGFQELDNSWRAFCAVLFLYLSSFGGLCSSALTEKCDHSVSTSGSGLDVRVCVRAWSPTSLEVTWFPKSESSSSIKNWILTVAASQDRRRVVSYVTLRSSVSRHVISPLTPDTEYFVFLDSVDHSDWYLTMTARPVAVRTLAPGESRTRPTAARVVSTAATTKLTEGLNEQSRMREGSGERGSGGKDTTTSRAKLPDGPIEPNEQSRIRQGREDGRSGVKGASTATTKLSGGTDGQSRIREGREQGRSGVTEQRRSGEEKTISVGTENVRGAEKEQEKSGTSRLDRKQEEATVQESLRKVNRASGTRRQNGRRVFQTTKKPIETTRYRVRVPNTRKPYGSRGSRKTRKTDGERRGTREERIYERRENIKRRTEAPWPHKPSIVSTSPRQSVTFKPSSTTAKSYSRNFRSNKKSSSPGTPHTTNDIDASRNTSNADHANSGSQSEMSNGRDAGSRMLWWVLVVSGGSGGFFLALIMITLLIKRSRRKCSSLECPHLEQELSQTSRSSNRSNRPITDATKQDTANKPKPTNGQNTSENGYTRSPSVPQTRPLPPIIVSADSGENCMSGNVSAKCKQRRRSTCAKYRTSINERGEESIYMTLGDDLIAPDPARVVSIVSWGSEFDILDETKKGIYGNLSTSKSLEKVYGNLDTTYGNMATLTSTTTSPQLQQPPSAATLPKLTTTTRIALPDLEKVQSPHPYAVPRRQTSTSSAPNFEAPAPPSDSTSPEIPSELLSHLKTVTQPSPSLSLQQQQQQQQPASLPGLDLPKEKLQQMVMLLLSKSSEPAAADVVTMSPTQ